jgi:hypothetical protein
VAAVGVGFELFVRVEPGGVRAGPADGDGAGVGGDVVGEVLDCVGCSWVMVRTGTTGTTGLSGAARVGDG